MSQIPLTVKSYNSGGEVGFIIIDDSPNRLSADVSFSASNYPTVTFANLKAKLPEYWPKLASSAVCRDMFGGEWKLNDYSYMNEAINPIDGGQTLTHKLTIELLAAPPAEIIVDRGTSTVASSIAPTVQASSFEALDMRVEIKVVAQKMTFNCEGRTATGFKKNVEFTIPLRDWEGYKFSSFKAALGDGWPSFGRGGTVGSKEFFDFKIMQDFGIGPGINQLKLKITEDPTAKKGSNSGPSPSLSMNSESSSRAQPAAATSVPGVKQGTLHKRPGKDLVLSISMYITNGNRTMVINGECAETRFKKNHEIKVLLDDFPSYTFKKLKADLPSDWPKTQPGGTWVAQTYVDFDDSDCLLATGLRGSNMETKFYELLLKIDATEVKIAPIQMAAVASGKKETDIPENKRLTASLRTYLTGTEANVITSSENPHVYAYNELSFTGDEWKNLTLQKFKAVLSTKGWPAFKPGAFHQGQFYNDDALFSTMSIVAVPVTNSFWLKLELVDAPAAAPPIKAPVSLSPRGVLGQTSPRSPATNYAARTPAPSAVATPPRVAIPVSTPSPAATQTGTGLLSPRGGNKFCEECGTKASSLTTKFCAGCGARFPN